MHLGRRTDSSVDARLRWPVFCEPNPISSLYRQCILRLDFVSFLKGRKELYVLLVKIVSVFVRFRKRFSAS